jgi:hypothetical protein
MGKERNIVAFEVQWFWRTCQQLKSADPVAVTEAFDDLEVIEQHTDNETLKAQCLKMLRVMTARNAGNRATA